MSEPGRVELLGWTRIVDHVHQQQTRFLAGGGPGNEPPLPPHGVETPGPQDFGLDLALNTAGLEYFALKDWKHAGALLGHFLENQGTDFPVDPAQLMRDVPSFQRDVDAFVAGKAGTGAFDSGWINTNTDITDAAGNVTGQQSLDWYYALHDWRYRVTGTSTVVDGQPHTEYKVEIYKPYIFGAPRSDINIPVLGGKLSQDDIQHLNATGLARNFVVTGDRTFTK
ncbi:hypothetical protein [Labedaea rhizosphaerae]|uniref:Uncharacterized protein n=1 Tax=Labedaea rhizosphaerae TaxID=598644 RepID=A0A4R6SND7_LABRH|nr:hypothetical protein [Labedaea rhizosphaerae]TDQ04912.1 hypothetical protein EV186_101873 [Labedaea rhizosphaerae]